MTVGSLAMIFPTLFILSLVALPNVEAAKIGIFTAAFSNSQMVFNLRIAESLAEDGHEVVLIRPEYNPDATSLKPKNPKIREIHCKGAPIEDFNKFQELSHKEIFIGLGFQEFMELSNAYKGMIMGACKNMLANDEFLQKVKDEKIDLAFQNHIDFCEHGIAHWAGVKKWIATMPGPAHSITLMDLGIPYFDSYMPNQMHNTTVNMTYMDRVKTVLANIMFTIMAPLSIDNPTTELLRHKFGPDFVHISDLRKTAILAFVNNDPFLEYPYPHTQKIQFIGGIGTKAAKGQLKEPFAEFAKKAKKIVLVSFGSVAQAKDMPDSWRNALLELFRKNPDISFFWKFEEEIVVPKNVLRSKWLPQNDLLVLKKTVGFITHGGYNSLGEAVQSGTPCVFVPLIGDQYRNSMLAKYREIGVQLPKTEFTFENLNSKLHEILGNSKYQENVKKYQALSNNRLNTPEQILKHWTNLAAEHDLNLSLPKLNTIQLYNIDVYFILFVILILILFIVKTILRWIYWSCCLLGKERPKEKQKIQ